MVTHFKTMNTGTIAATAYDEETWTPDTRIVIKKILIIEHDDKPLSNVKAYIKIAGDPYTHDYVPASAIGSDTEYCWKPDLTVEKGAEIYVKLLNNTADSIDCDIVIEYEKVM